MRLLYQHGEFTSADTVRVAATLVTFSLGLVFNGLSLLLTRAFFGLQEPRIPTLVAVVNLFLNLVLDLALLRLRRRRHRPCHLDRDQLQRGRAGGAAAPAGGARCTAATSPEVRC